MSNEDGANCVVPSIMQEHQSKVTEVLKLGNGVSPEDVALASKEKEAIEFVFAYAKRWNKFIKEVTTCLEKRNAFEVDCSRNINRQFNGLLSSVSSMMDIPLKNEIEMLSQRFVEDCRDTESLNGKRLQGLVDALHRQRAQFERLQQQLKQEWKIEVKQMLDAENVLYRARGAYHQKCQTTWKLREELALADANLKEITLNSEPSPSSSTSSQLTNFNSFTLAQSISNVSPLSSNQISKSKGKVERLEKFINENMVKEQEAMLIYQDAVTFANTRSQALATKRVQIICDIRLATTTNDEILRNVIAEYITLCGASLLSTYSKFAEVVECVKSYQPCSAFTTAANDCIRATTNEPTLLDRFTFEPYQDINTPTSTRNKVPIGGGLRKYGQKDCGISRFPSMPRTTSVNNETTSITSGRSLSNNIQSDSEEEQEPNLEPSILSRTVFSQFVGFGSSLFRPGELRKQVPKKARATVDSPGNVQLTNTEKDLTCAYMAIARCIREIESNSEGLATIGIYRVPASKLKVFTVVEALRTSFDDVDLTEEHPLTLASVLKNKLITLPEPLLTWNLYQPFVDIGREYDSGLNLNETVGKLKTLIQELPPMQKNIATLLFFHLKRVADNKAENQMGATNLGTLFGPTLLRPKSSLQSGSMTEFMDNRPQTKVVELLIENVLEIFGVAEVFYNSESVFPQHNEKPQCADSKLSDFHLHDRVVTTPSPSPSPHHIILSPIEISKSSEVPNPKFYYDNEQYSTLSLSPSNMLDTKFHLPDSSPSSDSLSSSPLVQTRLALQSEKIHQFAKPTIATLRYSAPLAYQENDGFPSSNSPSTSTPTHPDTYSGHHSFGNNSLTVGLDSGQGLPPLWSATENLLYFKNKTSSNPLEAECDSSTHTNKFPLLSTFTHLDVDEIPFGDQEIVDSPILSATSRQTKSSLMRSSPFSPRSEFTKISPRFSSQISTESFKSSHLSTTVSNQSSSESLLETHVTSYFIPVSSSSFASSKYVFPVHSSSPPSPPSTPQPEMFRNQPSHDLETPSFTQDLPFLNQEEKKDFSSQQPPKVLRRTNLPTAIHNKQIISSLGGSKQISSSLHNLPDISSTPLADYSSEDEATLIKTIRQHDQGSFHGPMDQPDSCIPGTSANRFISTQPSQQGRGKRVQRTFQKLKRFSFTIGRF